MRRLPAVILLSFLLPLGTMGQEYSYTRYTDKDGLAGSVVHCMVQDKQGFLWFGTETGLSRFDGAHFKNFYREDGLPDNEVIKLFADSKDRIWISPFKKSVCYYYKNKIYNPDNDSTLKKVKVKSNIIGFAEDETGSILIQDLFQLTEVRKNGEVRAYRSINNTPITYVSKIGSAKGGGFWVVESDKLYLLKNGHFSLLHQLDFPHPHFSAIDIDTTRLFYVATDNSKTGIIQTWGKDASLNNPHFIKGIDPLNHINTFLLGNNLCLGYVDGVYLYDVNNINNVRHFLPGIRVSNGLKDAEGSLWFCTQGQGVFRLNSEVVVNLKLNKNKKSDQQVFCFSRNKQYIFVGADASNTIYSIDASTGKLETHTVLHHDLQMYNSPVIAMYSNDNNDIIYGSRFWLVKTNLLSKKIQVSGNIYAKSIVPYKDKLLVVTDKRMLVVNVTKFAVEDTVWRERTTCGFADNDTFYIGTLDGLYKRLPDGSTWYLGEKDPAFRNRISAMAKDSQGVLWIATYGDGIKAWKTDHIVAELNRANGLNSNICRTLFLNGNALWVGTDKGVNKINIDKPGYPVKKYTTGDGLMSDIINAIYVDGNKVFIGTRGGLTFFDERNMRPPTSCGLAFTDIIINGQLHNSDSMPGLLPHNTKNIQFDYAGISYRSAGDIRYHYRLLGLDTAWRETRENFLSYPTLPTGDYELQLQAINKFDVFSKTISARFTIEALLWEKTWFKILIAIFFMVLTALLIVVISGRIRRREQEKTAISNRINELEQLARKAQMNPHFIFNSLNSIQQYVMDADVVGANKFISGFSRLIRQTLDFSSKQEISLEEEIGYLTNYLELERTRLENAFSWSVDIAPNVKPSEYHIPPMILQPFVENSVRHGLRFRRDTAGKVTISIKKENSFLVCVLEDNGIGRKTALKYKSANPIEYQSKGLSLTAERINLLNKDNPRKIELHIDDLEDEHQNALGTRVTINFPIK